MTQPVTCDQWARLVQTAEAHRAGFVIVTGLGRPYRVDTAKRIVYLDGGQPLVPDGYQALAAGLAELTHGNVVILAPSATSTPPTRRRTS